MKRRAVTRIMAAVITAVFMALIRTDADPELWQVALTTLGIYECAVMTIQFTRKEIRKNRKKKVVQIWEQDARRWAEEWFNPIREVN